MICSWIYLHSIVHKFSIMFDMCRIGEFVERVGRSAGTVRRWEREGRLTARRGPGGQRYFDESDVRKVLRPGFDESARRAEKKLRDDLAGGGV